MRVKDFKVRLVERKGIKEFVEKWHYSQSINGLRISYCFGLFHEEQLIGACIFGAR